MKSTRFRVLLSWFKSLTQQLFSAFSGDNRHEFHRRTDFCAHRSLECSCSFCFSFEHLLNATSGFVELQLHMASRGSLKGSDELTDLFEGMTVRDQQYDDHQWSWETFLEPLNLSREHESNVLAVDSVYPRAGSLVEKFASRLNKQHEKKVQERKQAVTKARAEFIDDIENLLTSRDTLLPSNDDIFERPQRSLKAYEKASEMKSDAESSGSTWTVKKLEHYISRDDIEFVRSIPCVREDEAVSNEIVKKVSYIRFDPIRIDLRTECDTRMVLDAILLPLCAHKGFTLRTEQTIKCNNPQLPTNRFDYIIRNCEGRPIGAVEAKRRGSLEGKSVAQLIVQLLLLSVKDPKLFYLGILSDGCQFIFVGLCEKKVCFFQTKQIGELEIATIKSEQDVETITKTILNFVDFTIEANERILEGTTVECILEEISVPPMDKGLLVSQTPLGTQSRGSSFAAPNHPPASSLLLTSSARNPIERAFPFHSVPPRQSFPQHSPIPYFFPRNPMAGAFPFHSVPPRQSFPQHSPIPYFFPRNPMAGAFPFNPIPPRQSFPQHSLTPYFFPRNPMAGAFPFHSVPLHQSFPQHSPMPYFFPRNPMAGAFPFHSVPPCQSFPQYSPIPSFFPRNPMAGAFPFNPIIPRQSFPQHSPIPYFFPRNPMAGAFPFNPIIPRQSFPQHSPIPYFFS